MTSLRIAFLFLFIFAVGCASSPPLKVVDELNVNRFMGDWYVVAHIPIIFEAKAFNAVERYTLNEDGDVDVVFSFNKGGFDGPEKAYESKAFIDESQLGQWQIQFLWPFKSDFRVVYVDKEYQHTVIARQARDYVWLMSRSPVVSEAELARMTQVVQATGYDIEKLRIVPHNVIEPTIQP